MFPLPTSQPCPVIITDDDDDDGGGIPVVKSFLLGSLPNKKTTSFEFFLYILFTFTLRKRRLKLKTLVEWSGVEWGEERRNTIFYFSQSINPALAYSTSVKSTFCWNIPESNGEQKERLLYFMFWLEHNSVGFYDSSKNMTWHDEMRWLRLWLWHVTLIIIMMAWLLSSRWMSSLWSLCGNGLESAVKIMSFYCSNQLCFIWVFVHVKITVAVTI